MTSGNLIFKVLNPAAYLPKDEVISYTLSFDEV